MAPRKSGSIQLEFLPGAIVPAAALLLITTSRFGFREGLADSILFVLSLLAHEVGHALAAWMNGTRCSAIGFCLFGAYNRRERAEGLAEFLIAFAGPSVNLVIAALTFHSINSLGWLGEMNLMLAAFNLLPYGNSDGQRMLKIVRENLRRRTASSSTC